MFPAFMNMDIYLKIILLEMYNPNLEMIAFCRHYCSCCVISPCDLPTLMIKKVEAGAVLSQNN